MAECYVSAEDYRVYWKGQHVKAVAPAVWDGIEQRIGPADRRTTLHERRWEATRGRRFHLRDRRRS